MGLKFTNALGEHHLEVKRNGHTELSIYVDETEIFQSNHHTRAVAASFYRAPNMLLSLNDLVTLSSISLPGLELNRISIIQAANRISESNSPIGKNVLKFSNNPQIYAFCTGLDAIDKIKNDIEGLNLRAGITIGGIIRADAMAKYLKKG